MEFLNFVLHLNDYESERHDKANEKFIHDNQIVNYVVDHNESN